MNIKERMVDFVERFDPHFRKQVQQVVHEQLSFSEVQVDLDAHLQDSLTAYIQGGKRIRPFLIELISGKNLTDTDVYNAAVSIELFHLMALIHDDIMDQSPLRRGVPSIHTAVQQYAKNNQRLGEDIAMLIGDAMLVESLRFGGRLPQDVFEFLTTSMQRTVRGQYLDVFGMNFDFGDVSYEMVEARELLKTAWYTFAGPAKLGLLLQDNPLSKEDQQKVVDVYLALGYLFQIRDDILDCNKERTDKRPFEDIIEGQTTWVSFYLKEHHSEAFNKVLEARENNVDDIATIFEDIDLMTPYYKEYAKVQEKVETLKDIDEDIYTKTHGVLELLVMK
jgi:geranylgeranyl diphosphate synthase type I